MQLLLCTGHHDLQERKPVTPLHAYALKKRINKIKDNGKEEKKMHIREVTRDLALEVLKVTTF